LHQFLTLALTAKRKNASDKCPIGCLSVCQAMRNCLVFTAIKWQFSCSIM
jgi:hypothetical protein